MRKNILCPIWTQDVFCCCCRCLIWGSVDRDSWVHQLADDYESTLPVVCLIMVRHRGIIGWPSARLCDVYCTAKNEKVSQVPVTFSGGRPCETTIHFLLFTSYFSALTAQNTASLAWSKNHPSLIYNYPPGPRAYLSAWVLILFCLFRFPTKFPRSNLLLPWGIHLCAMPVKSCDSVPAPKTFPRYNHPMQWNRRSQCRPLLRGCPWWRYDLRW